MPLLAGKTDQRKTTPYLLLSHVQDLSRSPEIRQDPPTVTRVASVDQQPKHHGVPHASGPGHEQEGTWEQWQPDRWTPWCSPLDSAILACGGVSPAQNAVFYWEKLITRHGPASAFFFFFFCVCVFCAGLHQHADCAKEKAAGLQPMWANRIRPSCWDCQMSSYILQGHMSAANSAGFFCCWWWYMLVWEATQMLCLPCALPFTRGQAKDPCGFLSQSWPACLLVGYSRSNQTLLGYVGNLGWME